MARPTGSSSVMGVLMIAVIFQMCLAHPISYTETVTRPLISGPTCTSGPLGMESGDIPDASITASSVYYFGYAAKNGRLNYESGWIPSSPQNQWIQVDLAGLTVVSGVKVQGHYTLYVSSFTVKYSDSGESDDWQSIEDADGETVLFIGNAGTSLPVTVNFTSVLVTRFIRLSPTSWSTSRYRLKFEVLGCQDVDNTVRLVDGDGITSGRVEIIHDAVWGSVCDNGWDITDATIVCRQLGFSAAEEAKKGSFFGESELPIVMNRVSCTGSEKRLADCSFVCSRSESPCNHSQEAGVKCNQNTIRLVGSSKLYSGHVEIYRDGIWGTICDNDWDMTDAGVACRQLGFNFGAQKATPGAHFGQGDGPVYMDRLACSGSEGNLFDCPSLCWDTPRCNHTQDAGVVCHNEDPNVNADGTPRRK